VGSRLCDVSDTHSKRTDTRRQFRATLRWVARLVLISIAGSWLFLYLDSVYQRRRAEALFADLKSLDFSTAGFTEVRDIIIRYGGHPQQSDIQPRLPDQGNPMIDAHGNVTFPYSPWRMCTPQNCTFILRIMTGLPRIPLTGRPAEFIYTTLPYIGVRSWGVGAFFVVKNGRLERSQAGVSEFSMERSDYSEHRHMVPLGYWVDTWRESVNPDTRCSNQDYLVYISHGSVHFPANGLQVCVLQSAGMPVKRAFDVHLRCLNGLFRSCRFDELAPSAWADLSAKNGTGTRDAQK
jgi:hypothetical protein